MKKENRKMAQQRRAEERRKKELRRKISKAIVIGIPIIAIILFIIAIIVTSDTSSDEKNNTSGSIDAEASENAASEDETNTSYSTDSSLEVKDGDTVNIDYIGSIDGVEFDGGNTQGMGTDLVIGSGSYIDDFEEQLIGTHPGDNVDVYVTFPDSYQNNTDLSGKEALFKVTINGIYE